MPCNPAQEQLIWWIFTSISVKRQYAYEIFKISWYTEVDWKKKQTENESDPEKET